MTNVPRARIGMFIDGTNADIISKFYRYEHPVQKYIILSGLMHFIQATISRRLNLGIEETTITQAHYYVGLKDETLKRTHVLRETLWKSGVRLHTFPIKEVASGVFKEVGVDVALAFEATRLAMTELDIIVIMTGDGDFLPLVSGLQSLKKLVVLPHWSFESNDRSTWASAGLVKRVDIALNMRHIIDAGLWKRDRLVSAIFEPRRSVVHPMSPPAPTPTQVSIRKTALEPERPAVVVIESPVTKIAVTKKRQMRLVGMISKVDGDRGYISRPLDRGRIVFLKQDVRPDESAFDKIAEGRLVRFSLKKGSGGAEDTAVEVELVD